ncbi:Uu.00g081380.m01.CDS01 [Anthostomella pinea]|uniref:Uu.00g081380.m01.CDS01 n=1 Tax=Anthostomella pinea TaxID=933095 RepID=A0AAI8VLT5_9PEZI|nr:Uu.00g081380.m01.CDS01 [Anthostomella pinea]
MVEMVNAPGKSGATTDVYPPPAAHIRPSFASLPKSATTQSPTEASLKSVKSVESIAANGAFPLGSLRVNDLNQDDQPATPLTTPAIPNQTMEVSKAKPPPALLKGGDVFILDDLPANFTVGCDAMSFNTTKPFPGFKDLPPGAHLIWVAPSESTSSRSAYWIHTPEKDPEEPGEVYVKQWDKFNEVLGDPASHAEERFQKEKLEQIFGSLAPYQFRATTSGKLQIEAPSQEDDALPTFLNNTTIWFQLTFAISPGLLNRITSKDQRTWPVTTMDGVSGEVSMAEEARLYAKGTPQLRFMFPMDTHLINPEAEGRERTRQALDPTNWIIDKLEGATAGGHADDLVGELQFGFLTGMHLGNYSCLEQWWFFVTRLVFRSYNLVVERPQLARDLIQTFHAQLLYNDRYMDGDVLEDMPANAKMLQKAMVTYKARLDEKLLALGDRCTPDQHSAGVAFSSLEAWLWRLGWDLRGEYVRSGNVMLEDGEIVQAELSDFEDEDERGEFAPVVVDLEDGRETGLVSWDR